jgi:hypothetical protein
MMAEFPDPGHAAACGLFCPSCIVFIASREDPALLEQLARQRGRAVEDVRCLGCSSETVSFYCRNCKLRECATQRGMRFCGGCTEYPCADLRAFQAERPHRLELWQSLDRIKEVGYDQWYAEQALHFACPACGAINSAYNLACRSCGATPGSEYVKRHGDAVRAWQQATRR